MEDSFIIMTKNQILDRLDAAKKKYEESLPAWKERCWQMMYEANEKWRTKRWAHFGTTPPITMEEFKEKAREHWKNDKRDRNFAGFPKYWYNQHPIYADNGPSVRCSGVPGHFRRLVNNSEQDKIYVSSSDLDDLVCYEYECECNGPREVDLKAHIK